MARAGKLTEGGIQSAVWQIELGRGKIAVYWILVVLLGLVLGLWYTAVEFRGLQTREAMDQAQLARNLARGEGYTTYFIRPLSIWQLHTNGGWTRNDERMTMQHPDLENAPLYPWILSRLFKLLPASAFQATPEERVFAPERLIILPFGQICLLAALALVYFWGRRLFDHRVALTAALLLLFCDLLWRFSISGLSTSLAVLLVVLLFYLLFRLDLRVNAEADAPAAAGGAGVNWLLIAASAVLLGLCFLTRYKLGLLLIPAALYLAAIFRGRRALPAIALYIIIFAVVIAPWLVRNQQLAGHWLGIAQYSLIETGGPFGGDTLQRSLNPEADNKLQHAYSLRPLGAKFLTGLRAQLYDGAKQIGFGYLVFFFGVGLLYGFRRPAVTRLRWVILSGLAVCIFGMAFLGARPEQGTSTVYGDNLLALFLPVIALYGVAFFYLLLDRVQFRIRLTRGLAIGAFGLLNAGPMILTILPPGREVFPYPPYFPPVTRAVGQAFQEDTQPAWHGGDEIGCSDLPWAMAWQGDVRTVWLPMNIDEYYDLHDFVTPRGIGFMLLTPYMLDRPLMSQLFAGEFGGWSTIIRGQLPRRFPLKTLKPLPPRGQQYLFLDRDRFGDKAIKDPTQKDEPAPTEAAPEPASTPAAEP